MECKFCSAGVGSVGETGICSNCGQAQSYKISWEKGKEVPQARTSHSMPIDQQLMVRTNSYAVVSFVLSLVFLGLLGVIFGHIALGQINRTRENGKGLAVAGLVLGYAQVILIPMFFIFPLLVLSTVQ